MRRYRKWALTLGLLAATPGVTTAGPLDFIKSKLPGSSGDAKAAPSAQAAGKRSNQQIAEEIAAALRSARLNGQDIEIEFSDGVATLTGQIADMRQKAEATKLTARVPGVGRVENEMTPMPASPASTGVPQGQPAEQPSASQPPVAPEKPSASKLPFPRSPFSKPESAPPQSDRMVRQASEFSDTRPGQGPVQPVTNEVPSPPRVTAGIFARSRQPVTNEPAADAPEPQSQQPAENPMADDFQPEQVVSGRPTPADEPVTPDLPFSQPDNAFVQPQAPAGPSRRELNQQVAEQIAAALSQAELNGYNIEIQFQNGRAFLGGSVATAAQRARAEQLVRQVPGVEQVENRLRVPAEEKRQDAPQTPFHPASFQQPGAPAPGAVPPGYPPGAVPPGYPGYPPGYPAGAVPPGFPPGAAPPGFPPGAAPGFPPGAAPGFPPPGFPAPGGPPVPPPYAHPGAGAPGPVYDTPHLPEHAWPATAAYPNYAGVTYPSQYSASAWPYIGPFYPYPQVPLGWRQAQLEWDDGYWMLNFRPRTDRWWWFLNPRHW